MPPTQQQPPPLLPRQFLQRDHDDHSLWPPFSSSTPTAAAASPPWSTTIPTPIQAPASAANRHPTMTDRKLALQGSIADQYAGLNGLAKGFFKSHSGGRTSGPNSVRECRGSCGLTCSSYIDSTTAVLSEMRRHRKRSGRMMTSRRILLRNIIADEQTEMFSYSAIHQEGESRSMLPRPWPRLYSNKAQQTHHPHEIIWGGSGSAAPSPRSSGRRRLRLRGKGGGGNLQSMWED